MFHGYAIFYFDKHNNILAGSVYEPETADDSNNQIQTRLTSVLEKCERQSCCREAFKIIQKLREIQQCETWQKQEVPRTLDGSKSLLLVFNFDCCSLYGSICTSAKLEQDKQILVYKACVRAEPVY